MKHYLFAGAMALGLSSSANALDPAEDVGIILNNLQPTAEVSAGLEDTLTQLSSDNPAQNTSAVLGQTVVDTGTALVADSSQAFSLPIALNVNNTAVQQLAMPLLRVLDDPSDANIENLQNTMLNPDQITTIAGNLQPAVTGVWTGSFIGGSQPNGTGGKQFLLNALDGNVWTGVLNRGAAFNATDTVATPVQVLIGGTSFEGPLSLALSVNQVAPLIAGDPLLTEIQGPAKQLADAGAPLTDPVSDLIEEVEFDAGNLELPPASGAGL